MHDVPGELRRADGRIRSVRSSYERIAEADGDLLLSVLRSADIGEGSRPERIATLLENTRIPLRLVREPAAGGEAAHAFRQRRRPAGLAPPAASTTSR